MKEQYLFAFFMPVREENKHASIRMPAPELRALPAKLDVRPEN